MDGTPVVTQMSFVSGRMRNQLLNLCYSQVGVWAHGDYCKINPKTGGIVMLGRRYSILDKMF